MIRLRTIAIPLFLLICSTVRGQVIISLIFGETLNTPQVEFGLIGGMNRSYFRDMSDSESLRNFNLGFYFHVLLKNNSYLSTGVLVKSNVGATGMDTYPIGDMDFDSLFQEGVLTTELNYFYVPIMFHQRFNNRWYIEGGTQLGLRHKSWDIFEVSLLEGDLSYTTDIRDQYKRLDAGLIGGLGYKFRQEIKSVAAGINYYYGLMNVSDLPDTRVRNSSIYIYIKIPIGVGGENQ